MATQSSLTLHLQMLLPQPSQKNPRQSGAASKTIDYLCLVSAARPNKWGFLSPLLPPSSLGLALYRAVLFG
ncbi:unnamed protein product [Ectocarpus sp. CCAP 1310/34]|nr:unnamed protein product [Ectocarpus sp. CCAP 1310/34]